MSGLFENGLQNLIKVEWILSLETPLCIKSGEKSAFLPARESKTRNVDMTFRWNAKPENQEVEVQEMCFGAWLKNGYLEPCYTVPASSVRGALRGWTLKRLVKTEDYRNLLNVEENDENGLKKLAGAMEDENDTGLAIVADVFGIADKKADTKGPAGSMGRIRVGTERMETEIAEIPGVQGNDWRESGTNRFGPPNAVRHISVRGPVDRITQGARDGGLHYFMEFSPDQRFGAHITLINPEPYHLGLIHIWEREINTGILRFGGLSAAGRGRMKITESKTRFYALPGKAPEWLNGEPEDTSEDPAACLWQCVRVSAGETHVDALKRRLGM